MRFPAVVLAALLMAGCVGGDALSDVESASSGGSLDPAVMVDPTGMIEHGPDPQDASAAPVWSVGDAWAIRNTEGEGEQSAFLVVTAASADSYTIATTSETLAGYDAIFDMSYLGKIRARDLAGHQQGEPIQYFDFPLAEGKTWTTKWDGSDVALSAKKGVRGFDITGTVDGEKYVEYDYVPELKWWSHLTFAAGYGITIDRAVAGWAGELAVGTAKLVFEMGPTAPLASLGSGAFTIDDGQTMVLLTIEVGGSAWARTLRLFDPSGSPYSTRTPDFQVSDAGAAGGSRYYDEQIPPTPGEWHIVAPTLHDPSGMGHVRVHEAVVTKVAFA